MSMSYWIDLFRISGQEVESGGFIDWDSLVAFTEA